MNISKQISLAWLLPLLMWSCTPNTEQPSPTTQPSPPDYAIVLHGGAGSVSPDWYSPEEEKAREDALRFALEQGENILKNGGSSLDAVEQTIIALENNPFFNAGKGAVFTNSEQNELDASIMDGKDKNAGAVGGVTIVKNPIRAARAVMENSPHVLLTGQGANQFAIEQQIDTVASTYFFSEDNYNRLMKIKEKEKEKTMGYMDQFPDAKFGTVGCVALDNNGNIAAGTSTGGMTNKKWNRIGDSPIIGAGTYADNNSIGVSCTGHGEFFIRHAVAYDLSALFLYKNMPLQEAADYIINDKLAKINAGGGLVALDKYGNIAMPFNTNGMFRAYAKPGEKVIRMYKDEEYDK